MLYFFKLCFYYITVFVFWYMNVNVQIDKTLGCHWKVIDRMQIWSHCICVSTTVWLHSWTLIKHQEKKANEKYLRMLCAVLNKSWKQHPTKQPLLLRITSHCKNHPRDAGHCKWSKDQLISNVLQWTPTHGHTSGGWSEKIYCKDIMYFPKKFISHQSICLYSYLYCFVYIYLC